MTLFTSVSSEKTLIWYELIITYSYCVGVVKTCDLTFAPRFIWSLVEDTNCIFSFNIKCWLCVNEWDFEEIDRKIDRIGVLADERSTNWVNRWKIEVWCLDSIGWLIEEWKIFLINTACAIKAICRCNDYRGSSIWTNDYWDLCYTWHIIHAVSLFSRSRSVVILLITRTHIHFTNAIWTLGMYSSAKNFINTLDYSPCLRKCCL